MKSIFRIPVIFFVLSFAAACSSSRVIQHPYEQVSEAARERFAVNTWSEFSTIKSKTTEKTGKELVIKYYDWEFPDTKIRCDIEVDAVRGGGSEVYVFVKDYDSWFSPFTYSWTTAHKVLDAFEHRMTAGTWSSMPWEKEDRQIK